MKTYSKMMIVLFLLPSLLGVVLFKIVSMLVAFGISFTDWNLLSKPNFVGIDNYRKLFQDPEVLLALKNTFMFIGGYLPIVLVVSLLLSALLNQKLKGVPIYRGIYFISVVTSWVAVSMIFKGIFNPDYGIINRIIEFLGMEGPNWLQNPKYAMKAIIITSIWKDVGFLTVIFLGGMQSISADIYEAAMIDGANAIQKFFKITLPLLTPTIFYGLIISIINSFQIFDQVLIMTAGEPSAELTPVLVTQIYKYSFKYQEMGYATALSWVLFLIILTVTIVMNILQRKWVKYDN